VCMVLLLVIHFYKDGKGPIQKRAVPNPKGMFDIFSCKVKHKGILAASVDCSCCSMRSLRERETDHLIFIILSDFPLNLWPLLINQLEVGKETVGIDIWINADVSPSVFQPARRCSCQCKSSRQFQSKDSECFKNAEPVF
jgi:hypothetical protein